MQSSASLAEQGRYYDALIALRPLLAEGPRSELQEQALWQAGKLCETLVKSHDLSRMVETSLKEAAGKDENWLNAEPFLTLNAMGADIRFSHLGSRYIAGYGFYKILLEKYPGTARRAALEYALIQGGREKLEYGYNSLDSVQTWVDKLEAFLNKYNGREIPEVCAANLELAHIFDNFWELMTFDSEYSDLFMNGTKADCAEKAEQYKRDALKCYSLALTGAGCGCGIPSPAQIEEIALRVHALQRGERANRLYIVYD